MVARLGEHFVTLEDQWGLILEEFRVQARYKLVHRTNIIAERRSADLELLASKGAMTKGFSYFANFSPPELRTSFSVYFPGAILKVF